jgi:cytochrome c oxidase subunit II
MIPRALPALSPRHRRIRVVAALAAALALALGVAPAALADVISPEDAGGSPNAEKTDTLYLITLAMGVVIFLGVEGALIWSLVKHRYRRGKGEPEQIRGNTPLEVGWTIGAGVILVILTALTFAFLPGIRNPEASGPGGLQSTATEQELAALDQPPPPGGKALDINVVGQQYVWRHDYPGREGVFSYFELVVPVNTTVLLNITATDVDHSYWVPKLFGKADAIPGYTNRTWFKATKPGTYDGSCAELCGENHAQMRNRVRVMPVAEYEAWYRRQAADIRAARAGLQDMRRRGYGEVRAGEQ